MILIEADIKEELKPLYEAILRGIVIPEDLEQDYMRFVTPLEKLQGRTDPEAMEMIKDLGEQFIEYMDEYINPSTTDLMRTGGRRNAKKARITQGKRMVIKKIRDEISDMLTQGEESHKTSIYVGGKQGRADLATALMKKINDVIMNKYGFAAGLPGTYREDIEIDPVQAIADAIKNDDEL